MRISDWSSDVCSSDLILTSRPRLMQVLREELEQTREAWADPRRTEIQENEFEHDIEDLIAREDMVVTVSYSGYIKRVPLATYRSQKRGGKGRAGMATRDEDWMHRLFVANSHAPILFFTSRSEEHTSALQSLMRISYAGFC